MTASTKRKRKSYSVSISKKTKDRLKSASVRFNIPMKVIVEAAIRGTLEDMSTGLTKKEQFEWPVTGDID